MSYRTSVLAVILAAGFASAASADPIQYIFKGTGSGTLGASTFTNARFTITSVADTSAILAGPAISQVVASSASIEIEGLGSATFLLATRVFLTNPSGNRVVGFSRAESVGGLDFYNLGGSALTSYSLANELAETSLSVQFVGQWASIPEAQTTLGLVNISGVTDATFAAVIPAPGAAAVLGLAGIVATRRRRTA